jgi:hypothetical protein
MIQRQMPAHQRGENRWENQNSEDKDQTQQGRHIVYLAVALGKPRGSIEGLAHLDILLMGKRQE